MPSDSSNSLLRRVRRGDATALDLLFSRCFTWLRSWASGRLPAWARGVVDTGDIVQDVLLNTVSRLSSFEPRRNGALRAYLRLAVDNRIRDEIRRVVRRPDTDRLEKDGQAPSRDPSPFEQALEEENWRRYRQGLDRLPPRDQRLVVGRAELGYSFRQLAFVEGLPSADAARMATARALARLAEEMSTTPTTRDEK